MFDKVWKFLSSLKLTFVIFTLITVSTLIGSFIIQKPNAQVGQLEKAYSPQTLEIYEFFGFIDLFHSPWFVFILFLMGVNVICASIEMFPRHLKLFQKKTVKLSESAMKNQTHFQEIAVPKTWKIKNLQNHVSQKIKSVFGKFESHEENDKTVFYVNKAPWSHFGVYVVHIGVVLILIGGVVGSINGFEGQLSLYEKEVSDRVYLRNKTKKNFVLDFSVRANDIWVEMYEDGSIKDYFSDLSILKNGKEVLRKTIQVNDHLSYEGINFYQANYAKQAINEEVFYEFEIIDRQTKKKTFVKIPSDQKSYFVKETQKWLQVLNFKETTKIPTEKGVMDFGESVRIGYGPKDKPAIVIGFKDFPEVDLEVRENAPETIIYKGKKTNFELAEVTGLQVARDPGAAVVFVGSGILVLGILITFFTAHQNLWIVFDKNRLLIAGKSHRNPWGFQSRFQNFIEDIEDSFQIESCEVAKGKPQNANA